MICVCAHSVRKQTCARTDTCAQTRVRACADWWSVCVHASVRVRWNRRCVWLIVFCYLCLPECYLNGSTCPTITNEWEGKKNTVCECVRGRVSVCKQEWEVFVWVYGWIRVRGWGGGTNVFKYLLVCFSWNLMACNFQLNSSKATLETIRQVKNTTENIMSQVFLVALQWQNVSWKVNGVSKKLQTEVTQATSGEKLKT